MTGGGKDLKNRCKSYCYPYKIFNLVKIGKILAKKTSKPSGQCTEKNTESSVTLVNEKLRFAAYERRASAGNILGQYICRTVCREITKVVSDAQGKLLDRRAEKNTGSSVTRVNEKLRFAAYERRASADGYFSEFTVSWVCEKIQNLYQKLRFAAYDRIGGVGSRAAKIDYNHNPSSMVFRNKWSFRTANRGAIFSSNSRFACRF